MKNKSDSANPAQSAEQFIASTLARGSAAERKDLIWYIVRRLSEPYIWREVYRNRTRRHVLMIDERRKWSTPGVGKVANLLTLCGFYLSGIVTLNYDLLVEYALGSSGFNYGTIGEILKGRGPYPVFTWQGRTALTGRLPLAKLHGSISWDLESRYTEGRRGLSGHALIVPPEPEKRPPPVLSDQWELASKILRRAERLLVFGFAFNPYDSAVLNHLREAGRSLREVAIVNIQPLTEPAQELWPQARIRSFQPDDRDQIRRWIETGQRLG